MIYLVPRAEQRAGRAITNIAARSQGQILFIASIPLALSRGSLEKYHDEYIIINSMLEEFYDTSHEVMQGLTRDSAFAAPATALNDDRGVTPHDDWRNSDGQFS
jgi:hypothetical protein